MSQSTSIWFDAIADERRYPALIGVVNADVVVVGGGIVGVMTAWRLASAGRAVVLLEKNHIGTGDSGFTTAFLTRVPDTSAAMLAERYGQDFLKRVFAATTRAQEDARQLIVQEQIACDFKNCSSYNCSYTQEDATLAAEWTVVKDADPNAEFVSGASVEESAGAPIAEAIVFKQEARFHIRKFLFGLLARPTAARIRVFEESEVTDILVGWRGVVVKTPTGRVHARQVISTSGFPIPALSEVRPLLKPVITFALAARYQGKSPLSDNLFWDTDEPYQYYRNFDGAAETIVLGGSDRAADVKEQLGAAKPHERLTRFLNERLPGLFTLTHAWSGSLFETDDGLPYIDFHPHYRRKVIVAIGFGGNGMVMGGFLASRIAADLALGRANAQATLFSFRRTGVVIAKPAPRRGAPTPVQHALRFLLPLGFLLLLPIPAFVFFNARNGLSFLAGADFKTANLLLFPLFGLYAFFLIWAQIIIGSSINPLRKVFPGIEKFHRIEGVVAFLFAILHPSMLFVGVGPAGYLRYEFIDPSEKFFVFLAQFALLLMFSTVGTALLRKTRAFQKIWRKIHYANYAVFALVWVHSWNIGSDIQSTNLRYLWLFFGVTAVASTLWRIWRAYQPVTPPPAAAGPKEFVRVASVGELKDRAPVSKEVKGQKITLVKVGDGYYAIADTCSHAGGPLSEGTLDGKVVECPWHGSRFDVTSGAVVAGPARTPQQAYTVQVNGEDVEVEI